ncbi:ATP-binding protein [Galactobacter sp.]|uniref:sensor histidine kinase n=1 Tax=Galactobacter sp. TaxID=2676125 RepID=UPI0025C1F116|nr:ATP-binding protein [Galactobacter sp.]
MNLLRHVPSALGIRDHEGLQPVSPGPATEALLGAITRVVLIAATVWQAAMVAVTLVSLRPGAGFLASAQMLVALVAVAARRKSSCVPWLTIAMVFAGVWGYLVSGDIDSGLTFAACWQINFASFVAGLLVLRRYAIPMVMGLAAFAATTILVLLPGWGFQLPLSVCVTQTTIVLAIRLGVAFLLRSAAATDSDVRRADAAALRSESVAHVGARLAEESRLLHDTAINTFAAVASAGAAVNDERRVRLQCARDVEQVEQLRGARRGASGASIMEVFEHSRLPVRRQGASDAVIDRLDRDLPPDVTRAVVGCAREAVNNAAKHSGADHVDFALDADAREFLMRISDDGRGFDPESAAKRGLATSIEQRAKEFGIGAEVISVPGAGTTVTLRVPLEAGRLSKSVFVDDGALKEAASTSRRRAGAYWGIGVTAESIVLTLAGGTNEHLALLPMIAIMLVSSLVAASAVFRKTVLAPLILVAATVAVFALSARATEFGTVSPIHWQALAPTGPAVLLLSIRDGRPWRIAGAGIWVVVTMVIVLWTASKSPVGASIVAIAGLVGLGFSLVWMRFQEFMVKLSEVAADARRHEFESQLRGEREAAAQASYQRWTNAGLEAASELLRGIRDGALDPASDSTRSACDEEERYLRQLVLISPELACLGASFMSLLHLAREADVRLTLRLGDQDTSDVASAESIAQVVRSNIFAVGRGGWLSVTLFPVSDGLRLTLTGPSLRVPEQFRVGSRLVRLGETELLEIDFATATTA